MTTQSSSQKEKWRRGVDGMERGRGEWRDRGRQEGKKWPCSSIIWSWIKLARAANLYLGAINRIKGEQQRHRGWLFSFFVRLVLPFEICVDCPGKVSKSSSLSHHRCSYPQHMADSLFIILIIWSHWLDYFMTWTFKITLTQVQYETFYSSSWNNGKLLARGELAQV